MQDRALEAAEQRLLGSDVATVLGMTWNRSKGESATFPVLRDCRVLTHLRAWS